MDALAVDISLGGMRFEVHNLPRELGRAIGPDLTVAATFHSPALRLSGDVFLNIAWFHPYAGRESSARASIGAYFTRISDADRDQLMHLAEFPSTVRGRLGPMARLVVGLSLLLGTGLALGLPYAAQLHGQVTELTHRVDQLGTLLELERRAHDRALAQKRADGPDVVMASTVAALGPASTDAGEEAPRRSATIVRIDKPRGRGTKPRTIEFQVRRTPDGISLKSLELLQGDFIGTLTSEEPEDLGVAVFLDYGCQASDEDGGISRCICEAPQIAVPKHGKIEFACISHATNAFAEDLPVVVTIQ
jgi:hypothetical protein